MAAELRAGGTKSTGKLYTELFPHHEMSRDDFENLLGGMARAGIVRLDDAVFEKDGRQIPYRTAKLTRAGSEVDAQTPLELVMKDREPPPPPASAEEGRGQRRWPWAERHSALLVNTGCGSPRRVRQRNPSGRRHAKPDLDVEEALRAWRLAEARRLGVPAFRIFTDRALSGLVSLRPSTTSEMLSVPGIGLRIAEKYGHEIRRILHG